eukprot:COSAG01_NODE_24569_length_774_cov_1.300741_1_plen_67_part_00
MFSTSSISCTLTHQGTVQPRYRAQYEVLDGPTTYLYRYHVCMLVPVQLYRYTCTGTDTVRVYADKL